jgi:hypothetical protein
MKFFHGTDDERDELHAGNPNYSGSLGYGLYLTTSPHFAAKFGRVVLEVESPVPDELVAHIEPWLHECGDSLVLGTPGSTPFTFVMKDLESGEEEKFSVLEDCEERVKAQLMEQAVDEVRHPSVRDVAGDLTAEEQRAVSEGMSHVRDKMAEGETYIDIDDIVDDVASELDLDDGDVDFGAIEDALQDYADEVVARVEAWVEKVLGTEIGLDDLTKEMEALGYSALWIDGYAPGGDEYIIFDDQYLPLKVPPQAQAS